MSAQRVARARSTISCRSAAFLSSRVFFAAMRASMAGLSSSAASALRCRSVTRSASARSFAYRRSTVRSAGGSARAQVAALLYPAISIAARAYGALRLSRARLAAFMPARAMARRARVSELRADADDARGYADARAHRASARRRTP